MLVSSGFIVFFLILSFFLLALFLFLVVLGLSLRSFVLLGLTQSKSDIGIIPKLFSRLY